VKKLVDSRENLYFGLRIFFSLLVLVGIVLAIAGLGASARSMGAATVTTLLVYLAILVLFFLFQKIYLVGYLKGNGIAVSKAQFPEVFELYLQMGADLGLKRLPGLFVLQQGGALNAFALRFSGRNYIAIYSEVFSLVSTDPEAVRFVLGHELGHVKRRHMSKRFWTCLSAVIPFLGPAYSRRCEFTCDRFGQRFASENPLRGLLLMAAGRELYTRVDVEAYLEDARQNYTGAPKFTGLLVGHPFLPARIARLKETKAATPAP
jgi:Zn-dependent protease with chaperone function